MHGSPKSAAPPHTTEQSDTNGKHPQIRTVGLNSTLRLRTSHAIHRDTIPIPLLETEFPDTK